MIDLRCPWEIERSGRVPHQEGLTYHNLSVEHRPYNQAGLGPEVEPERFLADLTARYGSVRGYATECLGVGDELVAALRGQLLRS
nr:hypothetical protein [Kitasatospora sp. NBC_01287]